MPERIQRSRAKGWRMPAGAVYVGRPTKWGNVYKVDETGVSPNGMDIRPETRAECVALYRALGPECYFQPGEKPHWEELRGKDLVCWCPLDEPCHADVLLEWANG